MTAFWSRVRRGPPPTLAYELLLGAAQLTLRNGVSTILDAVFPLPGYREQARRLAAEVHAWFLAVVCWCSDRALWQRRVTRPTGDGGGWTPADWAEVQRVESYYQSWTEPHLLLDAAAPFEDQLPAPAGGRGCPARLRTPSARKPLMRRGWFHSSRLSTEDHVPARCHAREPALGQRGCTLFLATIHYRRSVLRRWSLPHHGIMIIKYNDHPLTTGKRRMRRNTRGLIGCGISSRPKNPTWAISSFGSQCSRPRMLARKNSTTSSFTGAD